MSMPHACVCGTCYREMLPMFITSEPEINHVGRSTIELHTVQQPERLETHMAEDVDGRVGSDNPVPVLEIRRSPLKIRVVGENFDVSLKMTEPEDFEIIEGILARAKANTLRRSE